MRDFVSKVQDAAHVLDNPDVDLMTTRQFGNPTLHLNAVLSCFGICISNSPGSSGYGLIASASSDALSASSLIGF